jgi:hypothetical protein
MCGPLFRHKENTAAQNFVEGWLLGTPNGQDALAAWMDARQLKGNFVAAARAS